MNSQQDLTKKQTNKKHKKRKPFRYFFYDFVKITGALPIFIWFRNKIYFTSKQSKQKYKQAIKGGVLVACNHTRYLDAVIAQSVVWQRRVHTVAMKELFSSNWWDWFFRHILCIPIDREKIDITSIKEVVSTLKDGKVVTIFPEGHIGHDEGNVQSYKSGVVLMALMAKTPIIPVYIERRKSSWNRQKIVVGEPLYLDGVRPTLPEIERISGLLREKELELINFIKRGQ